MRNDMETLAKEYKQENTARVLRLLSKNDKYLTSYEIKSFFSSNGISRRSIKTTILVELGVIESVGNKLYKACDTLSRAQFKEAVATIAQNDTNSGNELTNFRIFRYLQVLEDLAVQGDTRNMQEICVRYTVRAISVEGLISLGFVKRLPGTRKSEVLLKKPNLTHARQVLELVHKEYLAGKKVKKKPIKPKVELNTTEDKVENTPLYKAKVQQLLAEEALKENAKNIENAKAVEELKKTLEAPVAKISWFQKIINWFKN